MQNTKIRVLEAALTCFNENGFANVRLQSIADQAMMSVGNLAYHYKTKTIILEALHAQLKSRLEELLNEFRIVPLFENWDDLFESTFHVQQEYVFFFLDMLEIMRSNPQIASEHREYIGWQVSQLEHSLLFNYSRSAISAPAGGFQTLAILLNSAIDLWGYRQAILGNTDRKMEDYKASCWGILEPYFTDTGKREFTQMKQLRDLRG